MTQSLWTLIKKNKNAICVRFKNTTVRFKYSYINIDGFKTKIVLNQEKDALYFDIVVVESDEAVEINLLETEKAICLFAFNISSDDKPLDECDYRFDNGFMISKIKCDENELMLKTPYKPDYREYTNIFDEQYINNICIEEYLTINQVKSEQYEYIATSGFDIKSIMFTDNILSEELGYFKSLTFDTLKTQTKAFFDNLNKSELTLDAYKRYSIFALKAIFEFAKNHNYKFEHVIDNSYFDIFNACTIKEIKAGKDGMAEITFEMPENKEGISTDGVYILSLKGEGKEKKQYEFDFVSMSSKSELCEILASSDSDALKAILSEDSGYIKALSSLGINTEIYNSLEKDICKTFADAEKDTENCVDVLKAVIGAEAVKEGYTPLSGVLEMINPVYEDVNYADIGDETLKTYAEEYLDENKEGITYQNFDEEYKVLNVLYKINNARYNELSKLMKDNEKLLGLDKDNAYEEYEDLSSSNKTKTHENMVRKLKSNPLISVSELSDLIEASIPEKTSSKGSSGGGGGGGGKGSSAAVTDFKVSVVEKEETKPEETTAFTDMENHAWAVVAVSDLYKKGIVSGVGEGKFEPSRNVTREEFVTMLVRAYNITPGGEPVFEDVPEGAWYEPFVNAAYAKGIVNGVSETDFGTGSYITRQDMITMIARLSEAGDAVRSIDEINDFDIVSDYAKDAVKKLYESGIVSGTGGGKISPLSNTTRAEAAQIIFNVLK